MKTFSILIGAALLVATGAASSLATERNSCPDWAKEWRRNLNLVEVGVCEGPVVDGKRDGHWVIRTDKYDTAVGPAWWVFEGPYVDGKRHGIWVERGTYNGHEKFHNEGPYVNGKQHGRWTLIVRNRHGPDFRSEGPYVDGKRHGIWVMVNIGEDERRCLTYSRGNEVKDKRC